MKSLQSIRKQKTQPDFKNEGDIKHIWLNVPFLKEILFDALQEKKKDSRRSLIGRNGKQNKY